MEIRSEVGGLEDLEGVGLHGLEVAARRAGVERVEVQPEVLWPHRGREGVRGLGVRHRRRGRHDRHRGEAAVRTRIRAPLLRCGPTLRRNALLRLKLLLLVYRNFICLLRGVVPPAAPLVPHQPHRVQLPQVQVQTLVLRLTRCQD